MNKKINKKIAEIMSKYGGTHVYFENETLENICLFISRWKYKLTSGLYFKLKYFFQRQIRGYDDLDKWNAGWYIARKAIAVLKEWRNNTLMGTAMVRHLEDRFGNIIELTDEELETDDGIPAAFNEEQWLRIIDDIIFAFEFMINDDLDVGHIDSDEYKASYRRHKKGMKLFSIYVMSLWD
jgi:hypothetical protein